MEHFPYHVYIYVYSLHMSTHLFVDCVLVVRSVFLEFQESDWPSEKLGLDRQLGGREWN